MPYTNRFLQLALFCVSLLPFNSFAQEDGRPVQQRKMPFSLRFDGGIGILRSPKAMSNNFGSAGDANVGAHFGIYKGFRLGMNFRYSGFQVSRNASNFNDEVIIDNIVVYQPITTTQNIYTAALVLGYDHWITDYSFFNFATSYGKSWVRYGKIRKVDNPPRPEDYNFNDYAMDLSVSFNYFFEDRLGMIVKFGYSHLFAPFKPETVALDGGAISYESKDLKGEVGFFAVGLGFAWSLKRID